MPDKGTDKKVTKVKSTADSSQQPSQQPFTVSPESKSRAKVLRIFSILAWLFAIGFEVGAILLLQRSPVPMVWLIVLIAADLALVITGSLIWKKSNRLDPASEKDKVRFFIQNQLGLLISAIAFLPLVILIFTNKNLEGRQKGILGGIAVAALAIAALTGISFNPPSIEQYAEQTAEVQSLTGGEDSVYWTKSGNRYHLYSDCHHINTKRTDEIFNGTVASARELKNITELCKTCKKRMIKEKSGENSSE